MSFVLINDDHLLAHPSPAWLSQMMENVKLGVTNIFSGGLARNKSLKMEVDCDESQGDLSGGWTNGGQTGEWDFLSRQWEGGEFLGREPLDAPGCCCWVALFWDSGTFFGKYVLGNDLCWIFTEIVLWLDSQSILSIWFYEVDIPIGSPSL